MSGAGPPPVDTLIARAPAPPWRRVGARLVDAATVLTVLWCLVVVRAFSFMGSLTNRFHPDPWGRAFVATVAFVVLAGAYEALFVSRSQGQTPGKDLMRLRVVPTRGTGLGAGRALLRGLPIVAVVAIRPLWALLVVVAVLGLTVTVARRRSPMDVVCGTVVVPYDRDREDPEARRPVSRRQRRAESDAAGARPEGGHRAGDPDAAVTTRATVATSVAQTRGVSRGA